MKNKELRLSTTNKIIAGVCGGIGEYLNIDPTIVRILFVLFVAAGGSGLIVYIILWLVIPPASPETSIKIEPIVQDVVHETTSTQKADTNYWAGIILILTGGWFLFANLGLFDFLNFGKLWPLLIVVLGIFVLFKK